MKNKKIRRIGIIANLKKSMTLEEVKKLRQWLTRNHYSVILSEDLADVLKESTHRSSISNLSQKTQLVIVLGGDGTLLWGARSGAYGKNPVLGVNLGTFGFLAGVSVKELYPSLKKILQGNFTTEKRIMLEARVWRAGKNKSAEMIWNHMALNDAVISKETLARMVQLRIHVNNRLVTEYYADGIIISTPTGSTAHSLSAGGPIVYPTVDAVIITPICPHTISNRPLIIKGSDEVQVEVMSSHQNTSLTLDGQEGTPLQPGDLVKIRRAARTLQLINSPVHDYYEVLQTKLHWGKR